MNNISLHDKEGLVIRRETSLASFDNSHTYFICFKETLLKNSGTAISQRRATSSSNFANSGTHYVSFDFQFNKIVTNSKSTYLRLLGKRTRFKHIVI